MGCCFSHLKNKDNLNDIQISFKYPHGTQYLSLENDYHLEEKNNSISVDFIKTIIVK